MQNKKTRQRLDLLLVKKGLSSSRNRAQAEIMAGNVLVDGRREDKPGTLVPSTAKIMLKTRANPYVSRGGLKLKKALDCFKLDLRNKLVLDIGASTGGFTHCALGAGARRVVALDVGYGQLAWQLRRDSRVISMERTNARFLKRGDLPLHPHVATIDVSFISLKLILPVVAALEIEQIICLIKPQFEAIPSQVGKRGVVKDPGVHVEILDKIVEMAERLSYKVEGLTFSPFKGPRGNIEYLLYLSRDGKKSPKPGNFGLELYKEKIRRVVALAWDTLQ